jgi:hypothetical protein
MDIGLNDFFLSWHNPADTIIIKIIMGSVHKEVFKPMGRELMQTRIEILSTKSKTLYPVKSL